MKLGVKQMLGFAGFVLLASGAFASTHADAKGTPSGPANKGNTPSAKKVAIPEEDAADAAESVPGIEAEKPVNDSPYAAIVERNIFALLPPPPPVDPDAGKESNSPPVNVTLTGITTIFGNTRAYFMVQDPPQAGKPPTAAESVMLTAGERRGKLEALEIDIKAGTVKIKNDGLISTITFPKPTVAASGAPGPGGGPPGFTPHRGGFTPGGAPPGGRGGAPALPSRQMRGPGGGPGGGITGNQNNYSPYGGQSAGYGAAPASYTPAPISYVNPGSTAPAIALNNGSVGNPGVNTQPAATPQPAQPALSPEEQTVMIEAQRAYAQQQGDPIAIILPPTEVSESEGGGGPPSFPK